MEPQKTSFIAQCLLKIADSGENYDVTNMKLQKLMYYAQGTCLALYNIRLFEGELEKWQYGPVVPELYRTYKGHGRNVINPPAEVDLQQLDSRQLEILQDVNDFFGQFSAVKLMHMTHSEDPWDNTEMGETMKDKTLQDYFNQIVVKE